MKNEYDYLNDVKIDFSVYNEEFITEKEVRKMSKLNKTKKKMSKKSFAAVVFAAALFVSTGVAAASGQLDRVIKTFTTGHNYFIQMDPDAAHELPEALKGKLYNSKGEPLTAITEEEINNLYDEKGKLIDMESLQQMFNDALADDGVQLGTYNDTDAEDSKIIYAALDEAQSSADFNIKVPKYIPDGFEFAQAYAFKDEDGNASGIYRTMEYTDKNGKKLVLSERLINEETAFTAGTDGKLEEIEINGRKVIIMDDSSLSFETEDNVSVSIFTKGNIAKDELVKMAKSME